MISLKKFFILILVIITVCFSTSYAQSKNIDIEKWNSFKESAHKIGFCIFHVKMEFCNEHSDIKNKLEKVSEPDDDIYYFYLKQLWATNRLNNLAKTKKSNSENSFILFDIDQKSFKKLYDSTKTSNSYNMFSILDLTNTYQFRVREKTDTTVTFFISSNVKNSIITNTMWREFFSNRGGRFDSKIKIPLNGSNAFRDYQNFKEAFIKFTENE